ncbi:hypothetical protein [Aquimarina brevivitae]|uniref:Uncharacterized protein n=1 Tax=Aquimarina brevivitae TaxID=323412 RepID=A0A4Q7PHR1_9FLAO|nr:hypothetical protein [Aquimarina brevivitae]RZT00124.1 hypothetical protein EV197_1357 [Aquimarina brevivitae]
MKKLVFISLVFLSLSATAQEAKIQNETSTEVTKTTPTKYDFYKTLVSVNKFDITINEDKGVALKTKEDFYNELMDKNGFTIDEKKNTRLAGTLNKEMTLPKDTTQVTGL